MIVLLVPMHQSLTCVVVGFGSHKPRYCLTSGWLIPMPILIVLTLPVIFCVLLKVTKSKIISAGLSRLACHFTSLCVYADGILDSEAEFFCKQIEQISCCCKVGEAL